MLASPPAAFASRFGDADGLQMAMAPGRVNLIGDYTDLNDGYVLPMAVDRGVYMALRRRSDRKVRVASLRYGELVVHDLDFFESPEPGSWPSCVLGVVKKILDYGGIIRDRPASASCRARE